MSGWGEEFVNVEARLRDGTLTNLYRTGLLAGPAVDEGVLERLEALATEDLPGYRLRVALSTDRRG